MPKNNVDPAMDQTGMLSGLINPFADLASLVAIMLGTPVKERAILLYRLLKLCHGKDPSALSSMGKEELFAGTVENLVKAVLDLFSATSIIGTLLLSVTVGALLQTEAPNPHEDALYYAGEYGCKVISRIAAMLIFLSTCLTMLATWFGSRWYIFLTCFAADHEDQLLFIMNENVALPTMLMIGGLFMMVFPVPLYMFLYFSVEVAVVAAAFAFVCTVPIAWWSDIRWQMIFFKSFNQKELVKAVKAQPGSAAGVFDCVSPAVIQLRERVALADIQSEEQSAWTLLQEKMRAWIDMMLSYQFPAGQLSVAEEYITKLEALKSYEHIPEAEFNAWMSILVRMKRKLGRKQILEELGGPVK